MKVATFAQRTPEWREARLGVFTASCADDMLATPKSGKGELAGRRDLRLRLALERLTGFSQEGSFVSQDMQRGIETEPRALAAYEAFTGLLVRPVGFVAHDTLAAGYSPDGVVGAFSGLLELKCPKSATHMAYLKAGGLPAEYLGQVTHALWITGAPWLDFVSFDDRFPPALQLFHVRVARDEPAMKAYELLVRMFLAEVDKEVADILALAAGVAA